VILTKWQKMTVAIIVHLVLLALAPRFSAVHAQRKH
jgi:hypothetical protein